MNETLRKPLKRIKTGYLERRVELARTGMISGTWILAHSAGNLFAPKEQRQQRKQKMISEQAQYFVREIGKLKGSVVKIGQMMALYGKYFLPAEVTDALHTLENETTSMAWPGIEKTLREALGESVLKELDIDPEPLAAASLGQVHRAKRISDGRELCIKVQYPGVAKSIDTDFNAIIRLLRMAKLINKNADMHQRLEMIREALHQEVDYHFEAEKTSEIRQRLSDNERYIVPEVFPQYSTQTVLTTSYEEGTSINHNRVQKISLARRNQLGEAMLDLFLTELFEWGEIQTDPNFGNYRVRLGKGETPDKLVLLDFGAMRKFPDEFLHSFRGMLTTAHQRDKTAFQQHAIAVGFMQPEFPEQVLDQFTRIGFEIVEPLKQDHSDTPSIALNNKSHYRWHASKLPKRAAKLASKAALSKYFKMPPADFMFVNRKLIGVYTFILVLRAEFNGYPLLEKHLP